MKVLVTAAYGHQGKLLIPKLAAAGLDVRGAPGTPGRDEEVVRLGAKEVFVGDLGDPEVYTEALEGCEAVYHIGPGAHPREYEMGFAMVEAAKTVGLRHVVFLSLLQPFIDIIQHRYKLDHQQALVKSGLNFTALRPCDFMTPEVDVAPAMRTGILPFCHEDPSRVQVRSSSTPTACSRRGFPCSSWASGAIARSRAWLARRHPPRPSGNAQRNRRFHRPDCMSCLPGD